MADDGSPDPRLAAALAADDGSPATRGQVWAALVDARLFLALTARALGHERSATTGLVQESQAEMSLLSVVSANGARALPAFCDGHLVQRWRAEARPIPVTGPQACCTALEDGADALLLDPLGAALAVSGRDLVELAAGRVPVPGSGLSTRLSTALPARLPTAAPHAADGLAGAGPVDPGLLDALGKALRQERHVRSARLLAGPDGPVLGVVPAAPLRAGDLAALAERVRVRLGAALPPDGLDLAVVAAAGPGQPVPLRRSRLLRWRRAPC